MRPEVALDALFATHGGLSVERCAVLYHVSPMALYRLVCSFGHQSLVPVLTRCGLPLPVDFLVDAKPSRCRTAQVYLPTIVSGRVIWHLGLCRTRQCSGLDPLVWRVPAGGAPAGVVVPRQRRPRGLRQHHEEHADPVPPGARLGNCLRHALNKLPKKLMAIASPGRKALRTQFHTVLHRARQRKGLRSGRGGAIIPGVCPRRLDG